jgi:hypothetical protein
MEPQANSYRTPEYICESCSVKLPQQGEYQCGPCSLSFSRHADYDLHIATLHSKAGIVCRVCLVHYDLERLFMKQPTPYDHLKAEAWLLFSAAVAPSRLSEQKKDCSICNRSFSQPHNLKRHMETCHSTTKEPEAAYHLKPPSPSKAHASSSDLPFECPHCSRCYKKKLSLVLHLKSHVEYKEIKIIPQCEVCHLNFSTHSRLNVHMRSHEGREAKFTKECELCSKTFQSAYKLKTHMEIHRMHRCEYCTQTFKDPKKLHQHVKLEHDFTDAQEDTPQNGVMSSAARLTESELKNIAITRASVCTLHFNMNRDCEACGKAREVRQTVGQLSKEEVA